MEDLENLKKKILIKNFGINNIDDEHMERILLHQIDEIYARLVFLDECGSFDSQVLSKEREEEIVELLSVSTNDFAKGYGSVLVGLRDKLTPNQKEELRNFDADQHVDFGDKKEGKRYAKVIKKILTMSYPYKGSDFEKIVDIDADVLSAIKDLDLSDEEIDRINNEAGVLEYLKFFTHYFMTEMGIEESDDILPVEHIGRRPSQLDVIIDPMDIFNEDGSVDLDKYKQLMEQYFVKLNYMLDKCNGKILTANPSTGGSKSILLNRRTEKGKNGEDIYSGFVAIKVNGRVILEPVGQFSNRTYIVPQEFLETAIDEFRKKGRSEISKLPGVTRLNHKGVTIGDKRVFSFDDHLFKCIEAISQDSIDQEGRCLSGKELKAKIRKTNVDFTTLKELSKGISRNEGL